MASSESYGKAKGSPSDGKAKGSPSDGKAKGSPSDDELRDIIKECCPYLKDEDIKSGRFDKHIKNVHTSLSELKKLNLKPKLYNDPIHGSIWLNPLESAILNTPEFYRLRHIKQLGGKCYVYPGAVHTRFEHSIGVCYLAGEFVKHLQKQSKTLITKKGECRIPVITEEEECCIRLAGLCHDLGHGPFSHVFEQVIKELYPIKEEHEKIKHEKISVLMFKRILMKHSIILAHFVHSGLRAGHVKMIKEMIDCSKDLVDEKMLNDKEKLYLYEIVANKKSGMDVDKWDYFARDCYFLGVQYDFDYKRCMALSKIIKYERGNDTREDLGNENGCFHIAFRDKEIQNIYGMFRTRCMIHQKACTHKVVSAIEIMIKDAIYKAKELKLFKFLDDESQHSLKTILESMMVDSGEIKLSGYMQLTDGILDLILNYQEVNEQKGETKTSEAKDSQVATEREEEEFPQERESQATDSEESNASEARDSQVETESQEAETPQVQNSREMTKKAQELVKRIITREIYTPVCDSKSKDKNDELIYPNWNVPKLSKNQIDELKELKQKVIEKNYEIECACITYASEKIGDPVKFIHFYSKDHESGSDSIPTLANKVKLKPSLITTPKSFMEFKLRLFRKIPESQVDKNHAAWILFKRKVNKAIKCEKVDTLARNLTEVEIANILKDLKSKCYDNLKQSELTGQDIWALDEEDIKDLGLTPIHMVIIKEHIKRKVLNKQPKFSSEHLEQFLAESKLQSFSEALQEHGIDGDILLMADNDSMQIFLKEKLHISPIAARKIAFHFNKFANAIEN